MPDQQDRSSDQLGPDIAAEVTREERELLTWVQKRHGWEKVNRHWASILAAGHYEGMVSEP
jgi:hypothetical protein